MKNYKHILEAVRKGISIALDDYEDEEILMQKHAELTDKNQTKEFVDLMNEVVDLGLPSGTLWCKYNLGSEAENSKPTFASDLYGNYYAWGETEEKTYYAWSTLLFCDSYGQLLKYCPIDKMVELLPVDDVAYNKKECHDFKFHIPTKEQCEELLKYTNNQFVKYNNPKKSFGVLFTSKINGNQLFFPAAGYKQSNQLEDVKIAGGIWTSTNAFGWQDVVDYNKAVFLHFDNDNNLAAYMDIDYRGRGLNIRPVINLK